MELTASSFSGRGQGKDLAIIKAASMMAAERYFEPALVAALAVAGERGWGVRITVHKGDRSIRVTATPKARPGMIEFGGEAA